jgi:hypothetical protein
MKLIAWKAIQEGSLALDELTKQDLSDLSEELMTLVAAIEDLHYTPIFLSWRAFAKDKVEVKIKARVRFLFHDAIVKTGRISRQIIEAASLSGEPIAMRGVLFFDSNANQVSFHVHEIV